MNVLQTLGDAWRAATSRTARRTAVSVVLLTLASAVLYGLAVAAYVGFYREYIPHLVRTVPVYLQYGSSPSAPPSGQAHAHHRLAADAPQHAAAAAAAPLPLHPYGLADLRGLGLKPDQDYDVAVALTLPRSPANQAAGNFMLELALATGGSGSGSGSGGERGADAALTAVTRRPPPHTHDAHAFLAAGGRRVVFAAARPALLPYTDPLVARAAHLLFLPYYLLAPAAAERDRLVVPMAEALAFSAGGGGGDAGSGGPAPLPSVLFLEVRSSAGAAATTAGGLPEPVQTYAVEVVFSARLRGLRWFMYQYRLVAFVVLTTAFWLVEVVCTVLVFVLLGFVWGEGSGGGSIGGSSVGARRLPPARQPPRIKTEDDTDDDEGQMLRAIKREDDESSPFSGRGRSGLAGLLARTPPAEAAAYGEEEKTGDTLDAEDDDDDNDADDDDGGDEQEGANEGDGAEATARDDGDDGDDDDKQLRHTTNDRGEASVVTGRSPSAEGPLRQRATAARGLYE